MNLPYLEKMRAQIARQVKQALDEDLENEGSYQDISSLALGTASAHSSGKVITREHAILCGVDWVTECFKQVDERIELNWQVNDGDRVEPNQCLFCFSGPSLSLLSAERCALNFLQTLSGTASRAHYFASLIKDTHTTLLDTRKTIPSLRLAQKYAVYCGGGENHRIGLYDAFLIKENHIAACGGITKAIQLARKFNPNVKLEIEVENLDEFELAVAEKPDVIMLDNFSHEDMRTAVANKREVKLEASGNVNEETIVDIAKTGVDYVSLGTLTKDIHAIDLSMRFD